MYSVGHDSCVYCMLGLCIRLRVLCFLLGFVVRLSFFLVAAIALVAFSLMDFAYRQSYLAGMFLFSFYIVASKDLRMDYDNAVWGSLRLVIGELGIMEKG